MSRVVGRQVGPGHALSANVDAGSSFPWEGNISGVNTANGNKLTTIPIVGWTARGGLPVQFDLYHNSQGVRNGELGYHWTHSFDNYVLPDAATGNVTVHWGDDLSYTFTKNLDGSYSAPVGIYDTLTYASNAYSLKTKSQVVYRFVQTTLGWTCASITDRNNNSITFQRNAAGYLTAIIDPTNRYFSFSFAYAGGRITAITDFTGRVWNISYNANGELTQITYPTNGSSYSTQFGYNTSHAITGITDKRGNTWTYTYNSDGSLASETNPLSQTMTYAYTSGATVITDPNGHTLTQSYTGGRLTGITDASSGGESYSYDSNNNKTTIVDKRGQTTTFTYDARGNMLTATDPLLHVTTLTYNSRNDVVTTTSATGASIANTYDSNGNLTLSQQKNAAGTVMASKGFTYTTYGLPATKTDSNNHTTQYAYDSHGYLSSVTTPNGHVTGFSYSTTGVLYGRTDALGRTTGYDYDSWYRLYQKRYPGSLNHGFSYDPNGNVTGTNAGAGTPSTTRTYDALNRVTSETVAGNTTTYTYDGTGKKGLLSQITDPSGRTITYTYDALNRISTVAEAAGTTTYTYDAAGNETGITNANGTTVTRVFDAAGRLTSVTNKNSGGTVLSSFAYSYDSDNRRIGCVEADGSVVSWGYDGIGRLTSESRTGTNAYTASYTLDGEGNRTSQTVGGATTNFTYNADDELTATSSTSGGFTNTYTYNANGEQVGRTLGGVASTLAFDYDGQLTGITTGSSTVGFTYDAEGRRATRTSSGGTTTRFLYAGSQILQEKQGSTFVAAYTYGNALLRKDGETPLFDGLGSERTVTNASQAVTGTITHEAFGQTVATTGSSASPYTFAATSGYRNDGDAGLTHVGARYYDAQVGRFITRDTYLDQKAYLYCEHEPVNHSDPGGHIVPLIVLGVVLVGAALGGSVAIGKSQGWSKDDWTDVIDKWDAIGTEELFLGGAISGPSSAAGGFGSKPFYPVEKPYIFEVPPGVEAVPALISRPVGGIGLAIGAGIGTGGGIVKGIAAVARYFNQ